MHVGNAVLTVRRNLPVAVLSAMLLSGCSGSETRPSPSPGTADKDVTVVQPGRPGEAARTVGPGEMPETAQWNHSDVAFAQMMIPHHEQALEMSRLATSRAGSDQVQALARRITGAQGPEIVVLAGWLADRGIEVPKAGEDSEQYDHGKHGHIEMAGMLTEQEMSSLEAAKGREFDRLFLTGMIGHHAGAVSMAQTTGAEGSDILIAEMAADVAVGQAAEIDRMREILHAL